MLPKSLRLETTQIPQLARKGKKFENEYFFVKAWFDDRLDYPKFAISISIKIDKRATVRNLIKRKLRAAITQSVAQGDIRKANYLVVIKTPDLKLLKSQEISEILSFTLNQKN